MSGIAVIFNRDGRPADPALLERMLAAIPYRGRDGFGRVIDGPVALGHAMLRTTRESLSETQPHRDPSAALCITMDGRVDNRDDLRAAIESKGGQLRDGADAELVLRAYECWGDEAPAKIIGDFAFAIWDGRRHELFCARDIAGIRPFYYYLDDKTFIAASELHQVLEHPDVPWDPNEELIATFLTGTMVEREGTLFRRIRRLEPSHSLRIARSGLRMRSYYDLRNTPTVKYRDDREYAEHFREVFDRGVRAMLRSRDGVAVEVSGGLDSSSIACAAAEMLHSGNAPIDRLEAFSLTYDDPGCDERSFAEDVARQCGLPWHEISGPRIDLDALKAEARHYHNFIEYPNSSVFRNLKAAVVKNGLPVVLTGLGGDQWLGGSEHYCADLILGLRFRELFEHLRTDRRYGPLDPRNGRKSWILLRYGLWPLLPRSARSLVRRVTRRMNIPPSINPAFARRIRLVERLRNSTYEAQGTSFAQASVHQSLVEPWMVHALEIEDRVGAKYAIEPRHPFYYRPVIEYSFAIPEDQRYRGDHTKFILREAMRGTLPDSVRTRTTKAEFSGAFTRIFNEVGGESLLDGLKIAQVGWVDEPRLKAMARERLANFRRANLWPIWAAVSIELWYRATYESSAREALST
jgi:asparagine synthase (glutamine-hydrolysing)